MQIHSKNTKLGLSLILALSLAACGDDPAPSKKTDMGATEEMGADMPVTEDMAEDSAADLPVEEDLGPDLDEDMSPDMMPDMEPDMDEDMGDDMAPDMEPDMEPDMPPPPVEEDITPNEADPTNFFALWSTTNFYGSNSWSPQNADVSRYADTPMWFIAHSANGNSYGDLSTPFIASLAPGDVVRVQVEVFGIFGADAPTFAGVLISNDSGEAMSGWTATPTESGAMLEAQMVVQPWDISNLYTIHLSAQFGPQQSANGGFVAFGRPRVYVTRLGAAAQMPPAPINLSFETPALPQGMFRYSVYGWRTSGNFGYVGPANHDAANAPNGAAHGAQVLEVNFAGNTDNSTVQNGLPVSSGRADLLANPNRLDTWLLSKPVLTIDAAKAYRVSAKLANRAGLPNDQAIRIGLSVDGMTDYNVNVPELTTAWTTIARCLQPTAAEDGKPLHVLISGERIQGGSNHRVLVDDVVVEEVADCPAD